MVKAARRVGDGGSNIVALKIRQFAEDLIKAQPGLQKVEQVAHANALAAYARTPAANRGVGRNAGEKRAHDCNVPPPRRSRETTLEDDYPALSSTQT